MTAAHNNAKSAMVASWVAQASFEPLGLTIAVAKDRAIESLMQVRGRDMPPDRGGMSANVICFAALNYMHRGGSM